jgi:hypothetical protein
VDGVHSGECGLVQEEGVGRNFRARRERIRASSGARGFSAASRSIGTPFLFLSGIRLDVNAELFAGGLADHAGIPGGFPDDLDVDVADFGEGGDALFYLLGNGEG